MTGIYAYKSKSICGGVAEVVHFLLYVRRSRGKFLRTTDKKKLRTFENFLKKLRTN